jgi:hypothetical protein
LTKLKEETGVFGKGLTWRIPRSFLLALRAAAAALFAAQAQASQAGMPGSEERARQQQLLGGIPCRDPKDDFRGAASGLTLQPYGAQTI